MRSSDPDEFGCEIYLKAWELGHRSASTMRHVDRCPFCRPLVHGGTEEFPRSIHDEVDHRRNAARRQRRRFFLKGAAAAAGLVAVSLVGLSRFDVSRSTSPAPVLTKIQMNYQSFDVAYASQGRVRIEQILASGSTTKAADLLQWIAERGHQPLYDLVCQSLVDPRRTVPMVSAQVLMNMDPVNLKPQLPLLYETVPSIKNKALRQIVERLVIRIESS